jgi:hypothetical protein
MKAIRTFASWAMLVLALAAGSNFAADQTWTGSLIDARCYLKYGGSMASGNNHMGTNGCGTVCLRLGQPAALLTPAKKVILLVVPSPAVADYVGQPVRVTGTLKDGAIVVNKFEVKKGDVWKSVVLPNMM